MSTQFEIRSLNQMTPILEAGYRSCGNGLYIVVSNSIAIKPVDTSATHFFVSIRTQLAYTRAFQQQIIPGGIFSTIRKLSYHRTSRVLCTPYSNLSFGTNTLCPSTIMPTIVI